MRTLVAVADRGRFKAFELVQAEGDRRPHLELVKTASQEEARTKLSEQLSDSAGRFPRGGAAGAASAGGMSVGERHDLELEHERRAVRSVAEELSELLAGDAYDSCWLAIAQPVQNMFLEGLGAGARAKIKKVLPLDLTNADPGKVLEHFQPL